MPIKRSFVFVVAAIVLLSFSLSAQAKVIYIKTTGNDSKDGLSWATAKKTFYYTLSAAKAGDEVWAAVGSYMGPVLLKTGVALYGGFSGNETDRSQRNWSQNVTVIYNPNTNYIVTIPSNATNATRIDGFTIRNDAGDGVFAQGGSPTIANNIITGNGGVGISIYAGSPAVMNNTISYNGKGGIRCSGSAVITNNTIIGNSSSYDGAGISISGDATVSNNIVAFNRSGIAVSSGSPVLRNNDVFKNTVFDYKATSPGQGDISVDPQMLSDMNWGEHLKNGSLCIDAGWNDAAGLCTQDIDGQNRVQEGIVDIGSDEWNGSEPSVESRRATTVVYVSPDGSDINNGSSWPLAKRTINAGLAAASYGGEVWVKAGVYVEQINLLNGIALLGGFAGTETDKGQRNWTINTTIIDGNQLTTPCVYASGNPTTRIDGFTIRNCGHWAIECYSSPTIVNNRLLQNGAGLYNHTDAAPIIADNVFSANASYDSTILCESSSPLIINNTVTNNRGTAIYCTLRSPVIMNNILALNYGGIYSGNTCKPLLSNNCVYNNGYANYSGLSAGFRDISVDPKLTGDEYARPHLELGSPCIDAGNDLVPDGWRDIDGQARIYHSHIDIGCDESDGTVYLAQPNTVVRVSPSGNDANDGSTWALAKKTVQAGIDATSINYGDVWLAAGTYSGQVKLRNYAYLYGGFRGDEVSKEERDWTINTTVLEGNTASTVVDTSLVFGQLGRIDGFTVRNGKSGIECDGFSVPAISHNTVISNAGEGIDCRYSRPTIEDNIIMNNTGQGVFCYMANPTISNNKITGNGVGIYCYQSASPVILNNQVVSNSDTGIRCTWYCSPTISNNLIAKNLGADGGGIECHAYCSALIVNNTIAGNPYGAGICCGLSSPTVANNIITLNRVGLHADSGDHPLVKNNCFYNPGMVNYDGLSAGTGDISADPCFVDRANGDYHLKVTSPCINAGLNEASGLPSTDFEGEARIQGSKVDIGADECWLKAGSVRDTKRAADGILVDIDGYPITAAFPDYFYIENSDRSSGIRVNRPSHGLSEGQKAHVIGSVVSGADGERFIDATAVDPAGDGSINPLLMINLSIGGGIFGLQTGVLDGFGLNNIGLLIKTFGSVTFVGDGYFYIDDGSNLDDNSGRRGIKVYGTVPVEAGEDPTGKFVIVTGISSCEKSATDPVRIIRTRGAGDVVIID